MRGETPESALRYILTRIRGIPEQRLGEKPYTEAHKREINAWFGGQLALDFDYHDLYVLERDFGTQGAGGAVDISPTVIIGDDAYFYKGYSLISLIRESDGLWKLRIAISMCWGCFGDHSFPWGQCWSVICQCCGDTGWESGDLEYQVCRPMVVDSAALLPAGGSARQSFVHFLASGLPALQPIVGIAKDHISPCIVRGSTAKIELQGSESRYVAILNKTSSDQWFLSAFLPLCSVCGGRGRDVSLEIDSPCPACGGMKWGKAGDLRYCRNYAKGYWYWEK